MDIKKSMTYQANPLLNIDKKYDVNEKKLYYLTLSRVFPLLKKDDSENNEGFFGEFFIPAAQIHEIYGNSKCYSIVRKTWKKLQENNTFQIENMETGETGFVSIFDHISYTDQKGLFFQFGSKMKPYILDLYKLYGTGYGYTQIPLKSIFSLINEREITLLEMLLQYKKFGGRKITLQELYTRLNVKESYRNNYANFKYKIIQNAIDDINKFTDYETTFEPVKTGKKVVAFLFTIKDKEKKIFQSDKEDDVDAEYKELEEKVPAEPPEQEAAQKDLFENDENRIVSDERSNEVYKLQIALGRSSEEAVKTAKTNYTYKDSLSLLLSVGIINKKAQELANKYSYFTISENIEYVKKCSNITNLAGATIRAIEQDWEYSAPQNNDNNNIAQEEIVFFFPNSGEPSAMPRSEAEELEKAGLGRIS